IFERLTRGEAPVKELTAGFDISQPAVSQHLSALRRAGLVSERREGRLVYYRAEPKGLGPLVDWIAHYQSFWLDRLDRLRALLKERAPGRNPPRPNRNRSAWTTTCHIPRRRCGARSPSRRCSRRGSWITTSARSSGIASPSRRSRCRAGTASSTARSWRSILR